MRESESVLGWVCDDKVDSEQKVVNKLSHRAEVAGGHARSCRERPWDALVAHLHQA